MKHNRVIVTELLIKSTLGSSVLPKDTLTFAQEALGIKLPTLWLVDNRLVRDRTDGNEELQVDFQKADFIYPKMNRSSLQNVHE